MSEKPRDYSSLDYLFFGDPRFTKTINENTQYDLPKVKEPTTVQVTNPPVETMKEEEEKGQEILVSHMSKEIEEDKYNEGVVGNRQLVLDEKIGKTFPSFQKFKDWLELTYGLDTKKDNAFVVIDNRVIYDQLETAEGGEPTKEETERWKKDMITLYNATYDFLCSVVVRSEKEDDIRKFTGIKN